MSPTGEQIYANTYDSTSVGWTGEIAAYARWARDTAPGRPPRILELACGSGRLALALTAEGCQVTGVDSSSEMIQVARAREPNGNPTWLVGDMRTFNLGQKFDIVMVPAHSFQFMTSAADQVKALRAMRSHLEALGRLIVHLDRPGHTWLGRVRRWPCGHLLPLEPDVPVSRHPAQASATAPTKERGNTLTECCLHDTQLRTAHGSLLAPVVKFQASVPWEAAPEFKRLRHLLSSLAA